MKYLELESLQFLRKKAIDFNWKMQREIKYVKIHIFLNPEVLNSSEKSIFPKLI